VFWGNSWRRDRWFFTGLAVTTAALAFVGFAPTYFLKGWFGTPALPTVVHVHGLLMTLWFVLLIVQTSLVAARRTDLHRRFGVVGAVLAVVIVVMTVVTVISGLRVPRGVFAIDAALAFVALGSMAQFAGFVGAGFKRRKTKKKRMTIHLFSSFFFYCDFTNLGKKKTGSTPVLLEHSFKDRIDIPEVVVQRECSLDLFCCQLCIDICVSLHQRQKVLTFVPNSHGVTLHQLVSLFA